MSSVATLQAAIYQHKCVCLGSLFLFMGQRHSAKKSLHLERKVEVRLETTKPQED